MSYCYPRINNCPFNLPEVENSFLEDFHKKFNNMEKILHIKQQFNV